MSPEERLEQLRALATGVLSGNKDGRTTAVLVQVAQERARQDQKWGEQNHDPYLYWAILTEEVGEAMQAALKSQWEGGDPSALRAELVQVAAAAVAFIECLDRGKWQWGGHGAGAAAKREAFDSDWDGTDRR